MKTFFALSLFISIIANSFAQDTLTPGYYIINSTAQYSVAMAGGADYFYDENGCLHAYENLKMAAGEVVIAYELSKGKYYCFDPNGRMVVFQGVNCLTKAPLSVGAGVGYMLETIELIDGSSLVKGSYYWIVGQNIANSTVKLQVADGKTHDVPQAKIELHGVRIKKLMKPQTYINVE
jgi:hypothetical protein